MSTYRFFKNAMKGNNNEENVGNVGGKDDFDKAF